MEVVITGTLVLSANIGLANDVSELGRGSSSMKLKFTSLEELRQWVERESQSEQPLADLDGPAEAIEDIHEMLREADDIRHSAQSVVERLRSCEEACRRL